ncbi:MAG: lasso peptide biosynthesis B2 protein [Acidobacteriota bacterium]
MLGRLIALPAADRWRLVVAIPSTLVVWLALRLIGYRATHRFLARLSSSSQVAGDREIAERWAWAVAAVRHRLPRAKCLDEALTTWWLLRLRGFAGDLRIGVRRDDARLAAHAWIDLDGEPLSGCGDRPERWAAFDDAIHPS